MKSFNPNLHKLHDNANRNVYACLVVPTNSFRETAPYVVHYHTPSFSSGNQYLSAIINQIACIYSRIQKILQQTFTNDYIETGNS
ncbi:hypothetical protein [Prolixibacter bellariivorans]|uniref:hypothetical protein n=1 Tax=Prolixibacter bellariivorans TaxID=314319 RepID=UPI00046F8211|nr:hypothetical protein [Prolixibacter bellariivorans]